MILRSVCQLAANVLQIGNRFNVANVLLDLVALRGINEFKIYIMTDKKWQEIINKCKAAGDEHKRLLDIAEAEYERRYGHNPSEVDDDWWIDSLHYCKGDTDLKRIKASAELRK